MIQQLARVVAAGTVVAASVGVPAVAAQAAPAPQQVHISAYADGLRLSTSTVRPGAVALHVYAAAPYGDSIEVLKLRHGGTLAEVEHQIAVQVAGDGDGAAAAASTRYLAEHATFVGGADVTTGLEATVGTVLGSGTYYVLDIGQVQSGGAATVATLHVTGSTRKGALPAAQGAVTMTAGDRFAVSSRTLPARGTVLFHNAGDTIHFADYSRVHSDVTDESLQAAFDGEMQGQHGPDPFVEGSPSVGMGVLSPGRSATLSYQVPTGRYALTCFVSDDETGVPHAFMRMHQVVTLR